MGNKQSWRCISGCQLRLAEQEQQKAINPNYAYLAFNIPYKLVDLCSLAHDALSTDNGIDVAGDQQSCL